MAAGSPDEIWVETEKNLKMAIFPKNPKIVKKVKKKKFWLFLSDFT